MEETAGFGRKLFLMKYAFVLGKNPQLSAAEISAVWPQGRIIISRPKFLILELDELDCSAAIRRLGGTIKIAKVFSEETTFREIVSRLKAAPGSGKLKFGLSYYHCPETKLGMEVKRALKQAGLSSRLVVSKKGKALSSAAVAKSRCRDFLVLAERWLAETCAVQEFQEYSRRDFGRPESDSRSGMVPPKLARMMINFSQTPKDRVILDPFCGCGTILAEAAVLGYQKLFGSDSSRIALKKAEKNLDWLRREFSRESPLAEFFLADVRDLSSKISRVEAIVSEPYLGPPLSGKESLEKIKEISRGLESLYLAAFREFKKILSKNSPVVLAFPQWHFRGKVFEPRIDSELEKLGFCRRDDDNLIYCRSGQKVWRKIVIWRKK